MIGNSMELQSDDETNSPDKLLVIDKLQSFLELLLNTHQLILNCQKFNYLR